MRDVRELEEKIGYHFHDKNYLLTALTHSSYANEHKGECKYNERLEFLGIPFWAWWWRITCLSTARTCRKGI